MYLRVGVHARLCRIIAHSSLVYFSSAPLGEYSTSNYDSVSAYGNTCANTEEHTQERVIDVVIKFTRTIIFARRLILLINIIPWISNAATLSSVRFHFNNKRSY